MVLDTSAVIAVLQWENEAEAFLRAIERDAVRLMSAVSVLEASILAEVRRGQAGADMLDEFLAAAAIATIPFDSEQLAVARRAYRYFGKGRHPARLNFGDCAAYALARVSGQPLLFKGDDFSQTDIAACPV